MIKVLYFIYVVYSQIWLNLPWDHRHFFFFFFLHLPMDNHHFGFKTKIPNKPLSNSEGMGAWVNNPHWYLHHFEPGR
jgi:hypothetical protein